jgi:hypothetical protein
MTIAGQSEIKNAKKVINNVGKLLKNVGQSGAKWRKKL